MSGDEPNTGGVAPPAWVDAARHSDSGLSDSDAAGTSPAAAPSSSQTGSGPARARHNSRVEAAPAPPEHLDAAGGPFIYAIAPCEGPIAGGVTITITGYFFEPGAEVSVAGTAVSTVYEADRLSFKLPPHAPAGKVDIRVTNPDGKYQDRVWGFEYVGPPLVYAIEPSHAPTHGGALLRLSGAGFRQGCIVQIGASSAQTRFISSELIEILAQPHPAGRYHITVWNPDRQHASLDNGFEYDPPPELTTVEPASGPAGSAHQVRLIGAHFQPSTTAALFGQVGLAVRFESAQALLVELPARAMGAVDLTLYNPDGQRCTLAAAFHYSASPPPTISRSHPERVALGQAAELVVEGSGFLPGIALFVGAHPLTIQSLAPGEVRAVLPAFPTRGYADVRVVNADGQWAIQPNALEVFDPAAEQARQAERVLCITEISPATGPASGGTQVKLRGVGFSKQTRVLIGGARPARSRFVDERLIEIETDEHAPGDVDVELRDEGALGCSEASAFRYEAVEAAEILRVTPNRGDSNGGDRLTIEGSHFLPATRARLGDRPAELRFKGPTELELLTPPGDAGSMADLVLIQPDGQRTTRPRIYLYE